MNFEFWVQKKGGFRADWTDWAGPFKTSITARRKMRHLETVFEGEVFRVIKRGDVVIEETQ